MTNQEAIENFKKIKRGNIFLIHQRIEGKEVIEDYSLCDMAISALEKQIPQKPGPDELGISVRNPVITPCGNCGTELTDRMWSYCPWCGQKIKWRKR